MSSCVPNGWTLTTFAQIFRDIKNGCSLDQNASQEGVPVTRIETISSEKIDFSKVGWVNTDGDIERFRINKGDILFSHINSLKHIGKTALKVDDRALYHGMNLLRFQINVEKYSPEYMHYLLSWDLVREDMRKKAKQAINQASLNVQDIRASEYAVPPLPEQQKIADILSSVDDVIENTRAQIKKLQDLKTGMMRELLTKGIGPDGASHTAFKDSPVGRIPEGWNVLTLGDAFKLTSGGTPNRGQPDYFTSAPDGFPWVKTMDLTGGLLSFTSERITASALENSSCKLLPKGTAMVALYGGWNQIGRSSVLGIEAATNQAICALVPNGLVSGDFANYWLIAMRAKWKAIAASSRKDPNITKQDVSDFLIAVPSMTEQRAIVRKLDLFSSLIISKELQLSSRRKLKKALMQDLLTGKVRVKVS